MRVRLLEAEKQPSESERKRTRVVYSLGERGAGGGGRGAGRGVGRGADLHLATLDRRHVLRDAAGGAQASSGCTFRSSERRHSLQLSATGCET